MRFRLKTKMKLIEFIVNFIILAWFRCKVDGSKTFRKEKKNTLKRPKSLSLNACQLQHFESLFFCSILGMLTFFIHTRTHNVSGRKNKFRSRIHLWTLQALHIFENRDRLQWYEFNTNITSWYVSCLYFCLQQNKILIVGMSQF